MHPILLRIPMPEWVPYFGKLGAVPIYSYGVMLGLSLVVGWYLTLGLAERDGLPREKMANNYVITALVAVAGSRLLYVVTNPDEFNTISDVFSMQTGGLVVYGGFLGGFLASWAYLKKNNMRLLPWADVAVPSLASGLAVTRVGCYLFGCDYGKPLAENAPGWLKTVGTFPHWLPGTLPGDAEGSPAWAEHWNRKLISATAQESLPVHPTQIYESLTGIALLALLLMARKKQRFRGQIFFIATFAYGVARFVLEILRDDPERGNVPGAFAEHLLLPGCLAVFAVAFVFSFSRSIESRTVRLVTQVVAFVPSVVLFVMLRPEQYAQPDLMSLSTSQFIGLASAIAVAVAFVVYDNAALAHPESAMSLGLPDEDEEEDEEEELEEDAEELDEDAEELDEEGDDGADSAADGGSADDVDSADDGDSAEDEGSADDGDSADADEDASDAADDSNDSERESDDDAVDPEPEAPKKAAAKPETKGGRKSARAKGKKPSRKKGKRRKRS